MFRLVIAVFFLVGRLLYFLFQIYKERDIWNAHLSHQTVTFAQEAEVATMVKLPPVLTMFQEIGKGIYVHYFLWRQLQFCSNYNYPHFIGEETDLSERIPHFPMSP